MFVTLDALAGILTPIILVAVFGLIVLIVMLLKRKVKIFKSDEQPKSDKEIAAEELDRLLTPVEDLTPVSEEKEEEVKEDDAPKGE